MIQPGRRERIHRHVRVLKRPHPPCRRPQHIRCRPRPTRNHLLGMRPEPRGQQPVKVHRVQRALHLDQRFNLTDDHVVSITSVHKPHYRAMRSTMPDRRIETGDVGDPGHQRLVFTNRQRRNLPQIQGVNVFLVVQGRFPPGVGVSRVNPLLEGVLRPQINLRILIHRQQLSRGTGLPHRTLIALIDDDVGRAVSHCRPMHLSLAGIHAVPLPHRPARSVLPGQRRLVASHAQVLGERIPHQTHHILYRQASKLFDLIFGTLRHLRGAHRARHITVDTVQIGALIKMQTPHISHNPADTLFIQQFAPPLHKTCFARPDFRLFRDLTRGQSPQRQSGRTHRGDI